MDAERVPTVACRDLSDRATARIQADSAAIASSLRDPARKLLGGSGFSRGVLCALASVLRTPLVRARRRVGRPVKCGVRRVLPGPQRSATPGQPASIRLAADSVHLPQPPPGMADLEQVTSVRLPQILTRIGEREGGRRDVDSFRQGSPWAPGAILHLALTYRASLGRSPVTAAGDWRAGFLSSPAG